MTTPKMPAMTPSAFTFSPALLSASPAGASHLLKHRSPAPTFSTPEALAAMGMTPGLSMPAILPPDETKKRELAEILRLLSLRPGRISEEGIERLAKRLGLECYKDTDTPSALTTMSLAGKVFLLDIDLDPRSHTITKTSLSFASTPGPSTDLAPLADAILLSNLSPTRGLIPPSLAPFADNLARLAKTDRLSAPPHLNCFSAITGIYTSLQQIYTQECASLGDAAAALSKGTGHPQMHVRGKTGLSIDYWSSRRFIPTTSEPTLYRVLIEVTPSPPAYTLPPITPVRTSSTWVSETPHDLFGDPTDPWLEPVLEELPEGVESARFTAVLDPPVVVPYADEVALFGALMLSPPAGAAVSVLEALLLGGRTSGERMVWVPGGEDGGEEEGVRQRYRLFPGVKGVFARMVYEVPFSHPKELVGIFAVLRQFVLVGELLQGCFPSRGAEEGGKGEGGEEEGGEETLDLAAFMADGGDADAGGAGLPVDLVLGEGQGVFSIGVIFPREEGVVNFSVEVGRNADVRVVVAEEGAVGTVDARGVERAVVVTEDIGVAVEWGRR